MTALLAAVLCGLVAAAAPARAQSGGESAFSDWAAVVVAGDFRASTASRARCSTTPAATSSPPW